MRFKEYLTTTLFIAIGILLLADWAGYRNSQLGLFFEITRWGKAMVGSVLETEQEIDWGDWEKVQEEKKLTPNQ